MLGSIFTPKYDSSITTGEADLKCTSFAPASNKTSISFLDVVPRTIESSITTTLLSLINSYIGFNLTLTALSLNSWTGAINVLPTYLFFKSAAE